MSDYCEPPRDVVDELRAICAALPDVYEEQAWVGTRWMVRKKTFAHVLSLREGTPSAHRRAAGMAGDICVVTFRAAGDELDALRHAGHPFFYAGWGRDVVGMVLDDAVDWDEVRELMIESYCVMAPKKLVALVDRPAPSDDDAPV